MLYLTIVEYGHWDYAKTGLRSLKDFLIDEQTQNLEVRSQVFYNLLYAVNQVHCLGIPHLSINPERVWIKNKTKVFLLPFEVSIEDNSDTYFIWYTSPKYFLKSTEYHLNYEWDLWSIGCIFSDLFIGMPPLFASVAPHHEIQQLLEALTVENLEQVFIQNSENTENPYQNTLRNDLLNNGLQHVLEILDNINPSISCIILNILLLFRSFKQERNAFFPKQKMK